MQVIYKKNGALKKISKGFEIILKLKLNKRNKGVDQHCSPTHKILSVSLFLCFDLFFCS
jgi:hypothetical protein